MKFHIYQINACRNIKIESIMAIAGFFYTRGSLNLKQFIHPRGKYLIYNEKNAKNKSCYSKKKNVATVYVLQQY